MALLIKVAVSLACALLVTRFVMGGAFTFFLWAEETAGRPFGPAIWEFFLWVSPIGAVLAGAATFLLLAHVIGKVGE
ncbi:MAG: hypothetical protein WD850_03045 [Candidatus Spechtbacterales bacterium]